MLRVPDASNPENGTARRTDSATEVRKKPRRWLILQGIGGLLMVVSFFLPAVPGCQEPIVPAQEVWGTLTDTSPSVGDWAGTICVFVAPYVFGLLTTVVVLHFATFRKPSKRTGASIAVLLGLLIATAVIAFVMESPWPPDWGFVVFAAITALSFWYWLRAVRSAPGGFLCLRWAAATSCFVFFGLVSTDFKAYYGLWISVLGAALISIGAFAEAKHRARSGWFSTLGKLIICRLSSFDDDGFHCRNCGYWLIGLTVPRCPECGASFRWNDYHVDLMGRHGELQGSQATLDELVSKGRV